MNPMNTKRSARVTLAGLVALLAMVAAIAPAWSDEPAVEPGGDYVAMGSSFASGPGIDPLTDPGCGRSANNYANQVADALALDLTDVTCSGATVNNLVDAPQTAGGVVRPPQVEAVTADTDLVTITIGGNDFNYLLNMFRYSCQADPTPVLGIPGINPVIQGILCGPVDVAGAATALAGVEAELDGLVDAIRQRSPHARIVFVDYITIFPTNAKPCAATPMSRDQLRYFNDQAAELAKATKRVSHRHDGVDLVTISKTSRNHHICSSDPWVDGWVFGNVFGGGLVAYHLNAAGMTATADLVIDELS